MILYQLLLNVKPTPTSTSTNISGARSDSISSFNPNPSLTEPIPLTSNNVKNYIIQMIELGMPYKLEMFFGTLVSTSTATATATATVLQRIVGEILLSIERNLGVFSAGSNIIESNHSQLLQLCSTTQGSSLSGTSTGLQCRECCK